MNRIIIEPLWELDWFKWTRELSSIYFHFHFFSLFGFENWRLDFVR